MPRQRRRAVSPIIATIILVAVAVSVGVGLWSYATSATGVAIQGQAEQAALNINQLNEKFVIFNFNVTGSSITIWFYNNGNFNTTIVSVSVRPGESGTPLTPCTGPLPLSLPKGQVATLTLTSCSFIAGQTYFVQAVAQFGNTYTYFQKVGA